MKACYTLEILEEGRQFHSSLIDMSAKCARLEYACHMFEIIPKKM